MKTGTQNKVQKVFFDVVCYFFEVWVQRCPRVVPGTLQGSLQGQNCSKMGLKMTEKHQQMLSKGFLKTFLKDMRSEHVSKQLLAFFSFFLLMQRKILCHICPSKVPTLIHLARGENLRWMPPRCLPRCLMALRCLQMSSRCLPDAFQMSPQMPHGSQMLPRCLPRCLMPPRCLRDASQMFLRYQMFLRCLQVVSKMPLKCHPPDVLENTVWGLAPVSSVGIFVKFVYI